MKNIEKIINKNNNLAGEYNNLIKRETTRPHNNLAGKYSNIAGEYNNLVQKEYYVR
jgi:hypothetical protein